MKKRKSKKVKKQEIEIIEEDPVCMKDSQDYSPQLMGVLFLMIAIINLVIGILCIIQVNVVTQYVPSGVYYPSLLISVIIGFDTFFWSILFIVLAFMGLLDPGYMEDGYDYW